MSAVEALQEASFLELGGTWEYIRHFHVSAPSMKPKVQGREVFWFRVGTSL